MTDEKGVGGLPDAGTIEPGDPGHIEVHDRMAELMQFAAERAGIILDPPAPKPAVVGEYGHVDAHNTLLANLEQIAAEGGSAVGGPPAPILTNPEGGSVVQFTSGGEGIGGPTLAYGAEIEPNDNGETVTVEYDDPAVGGEAVVSGTQPFTDYIVSVYGVNVAGRGQSATTDAFQLNYNLATGGDTTEIVDDYNGSGQKWQVHTFTSATGTLNVVQQPKDFRLLLVGGGVKGSPGSWDWSGRGGGGGQFLDTTGKVQTGDNPVNVGAMNGGTSTIGAFTSASGEGTGAPGSPASGPNGYTKGGDGGAGKATDISGAEVWYGGGGGAGGPKYKPGGDGNFGGDGGRGGNRGGGGGSRGTGSGADANGWPIQNGGAGAANTGGGGGGTGERKDANQGAGTPGNGGTGIVIVAYQIGVTTARRMKQVRAERAAREAGYATGYDVGVIDGIEQRNEEIRAMTEQVKDAVKEAVPTKDKK